METAEPTVTRDDDQHRYVISVDGEVAGFAQFRQQSGAVAFTHTEIDRRFGGRGLGGTLVAAALDDVRGRGHEVLPLCPFVGAYMTRHPGYADLVPAAERARFGL